MLLYDVQNSPTAKGCQTQNGNSAKAKTPGARGRETAMGPGDHSKGRASSVHQDGAELLSDAGERTVRSPASRVILAVPTTPCPSSSHPHPGRAVPPLFVYSLRYNIIVHRSRPLHKHLQCSRHITYPGAVLRTSSLCKLWSQSASV